MGRPLAFILGGIGMLGLTLAGFTPATAGSLEQKTRYFAVRGSTLSELDDSLSRAGPVIEQTGRRHPGATSVKFDGEVTYKRVPEGCAVKDATISLALDITLPKWARPKRVDSRTALIWQTLEKDITRHERRHAEIAINFQKRMESALRNLRPERDCATMERMANTVMSRYLAEHERKQIEFDTIEGREVDFRLRRAFNRSMEEAGMR